MRFLLSWQTWLCGGSVEILPCSRVGHLYQNEDAHSQLEREAALQNKVRIAETWLDSFKETFYKHSPEALSLSKVRGEPSRGFCAHPGPPPQLEAGPEAPPLRLEGQIEASSWYFHGGPLKGLPLLEGLSSVSPSLWAGRGGGVGRGGWWREPWEGEALTARIPGCLWGGVCHHGSLSSHLRLRRSSWAQRKNWVGSNC